MDKPVLKMPEFEEPAKPGDLGDILMMIRQHYWTKWREASGSDEIANPLLMVEMWGRALKGLSRRAIESALDEWIKTEAWPPQASDLRKLALRQGAVIYDPKLAAYLKEQYERAVALQAGDE